jgi:preprotein translocase subunit SecG
MIGLATFRLLAPTDLGIMDFALTGTFLGALFGWLISLLSIFLILLILVQRGRGGGLTGALGGPGGQSAFGSKAGDMFTRITFATAGVWILLCAAAMWSLGNARDVVTAPDDPTMRQTGSEPELPPPANTGAGAGAGGFSLPSDSLDSLNNLTNPLSGSAAGTTPAESENTEPAETTTTDPSINAPVVTEPSSDTPAETTDTPAETTDTPAADEPAAVEPPAENSDGN